LTHVSALPERRSSLWNFSPPSLPRSGSFSGSGPSGPSGSSSRGRPYGLRSHRVPQPNTKMGDPSHFIALIQGVSAQVDDNTQRKTRLLARDREMKPAVNDSIRRGDKHPANQSTSDKGKAPVMGHRSLPNLSPPSPSSGMEVESTSNMPFRDDVYPKTATIGQEVRSSRTHTLSSDSYPLRPTNRASPALFPPTKPKLHLQSQSRNGSSSNLANASSSMNASSSHTSSHPPSHPASRPRSFAQPPKQPAQPRIPQVHVSQSSGPPVLGMRRVSPYRNFAPSHALPEKQKGFKTPFLKQPPASSEESTPSPTPKYGASTRAPTVPRLSIQTTPSGSISSQEDSTMEMEPTPSQRSSSPMTATDSSFGDMSFDMDALEETMKMYD